MKMKSNKPPFVVAVFVLICWMVAILNRSTINPSWLSSEAKVVVNESVDKFCQELPKNIVCSQPLLIAKNRLTISVKFKGINSPSENEVISILAENKWINSNRRKYDGLVFCKDKYYSSYQMKEGSVEFGNGNEVCIK